MTRGRAIALAVAVALGVGLILARTWSPSKPAPSQDAFALCVSTTSDAGGASARSTAMSEQLMAAMILQLDDAQRKSLEEALDVAVGRWEARVNPLLEDLEGVDPDASLIEWMDGAPAFVGVARTAGKARACATDGFCVNVASPAGCSGEAHLATDAERERARFLAWPYGYAQRWHAKNETDADAAARALRDRARAPDSAIALVLRAGDQDRIAAPPFARLSEAWRRRLALQATAKPRDQPEQAAPPSPPTADARAVVVIPHLDVVSGKRSLRDEIARAAPMLSDSP